MAGKFNDSAINLTPHNIHQNWTESGPWRPATTRTREAHPVREDLSPGKWRPGDPSPAGATGDDAPRGREPRPDRQQCTGTAGPRPHRGDTAAPPTRNHPEATPERAQPEDKQQDIITPGLHPAARQGRRPAANDTRQGSTPATSGKQRSMTR